MAAAAVAAAETCIMSISSNTVASNMSSVHDDAHSRQQLQLQPQQKHLDASDLSDDDDDYDDDEFDEEYFLRTYRPLSNLPTPPPSWTSSSAQQSPGAELDDEEELNPAFLGPAVHLVNLLPPAASLATPSVPLVQAILSRTGLPMHTVALAVCIMDSLDSRFPRQWRQSCPLAAYADPDLLPFSSPNSHNHSNVIPVEQPHIDSVPPEVIVLAALVIAAKFTVDSQEPTSWYARAWGRRVWTCDQINTTERCVMENLGWRIMHLTAPDVLDVALSDMARAAIEYQLPPQPPSRGRRGSGMSRVPRSCAAAKDTSNRKPASTASRGLQQMTPTDSP